GGRVCPAGHKAAVGRLVAIADDRSRRPSTLRVRHLRAADQGGDPWMRRVDITVPRQAEDPRSRRIPTAGGGAPDTVRAIPMPLPWIERELRGGLRWAEVSAHVADPRSHGATVGGQWR